MASYQGGSLQRCRTSSHISISCRRPPLGDTSIHSRVFFRPVRRNEAMWRYMCHVYKLAGGTGPDNLVNFLPNEVRSISRNSDGVGCYGSLVYGRLGRPLPMSTERLSHSVHLEGRVLAHEIELAALPDETSFLGFHVEREAHLGCRPGCCVGYGRPWDQAGFDAELRNLCADPAVKHGVDVVRKLYSGPVLPFVRVF